MRLADEVAARDGAVFVGCERELAVLAGLTSDQSPHRLAFLTGPAGSGKSAVLRELARRLAGSVDVVVVHADTLLSAPERIEALVDGPEPRLLAVDAADRLGPLDPTLREALGRLPAGSAVVLVGRRAPNAGWWTSSWGSAAVAVPVGRLPSALAEELLARRGVADPDEVADLVGWADGHPLSLSLAAAARAALTRPLDAEARHRLERELLHHLTDGLWRDPTLLTEDRMVLAVAALAPAVDAGLLAAVLPQTAPGADAERWLRGLPFTEPVGLRIGLQQRVRRLLVAQLRRDEPDLERALRLQIIDHLADAARHGRPGVVTELREVLAPPVDRGVTPSMTRDSGWRVDGVRPGDAIAIGRVGGHLDPAHLAWLRRWLVEAPEHVVVVRRGEEADPAAVAVWLTRFDVPPALEHDAHLAAWLAWLSERDPEGRTLVNPVTQVLVTGREEDEVGTLLLHALVQRSGLPDFRSWLTTRSVGSPDPAHCGGVRAPELDLHLGATAVEAWILNYGDEGVISSMRAQAHADLGQVGSVAVGSDLAAYDVVREALRVFHDPLALARSPLGEGDDATERAAYVQALLRDGIDRAFGETRAARLHREVLLRGYLEVDSDHARAMRALHLSRTTYFRRVREATARLASFLEESPRPTMEQRAET